MEAAQQQIAETLALQASEQREKVDSVAADEGAALTLFAGAATASLWAAEACEDVTELDAIIDQGYFVMIAASRNPARLFPPDPTLLDTMTFVAWCHLERFQYRLDFFDLDEAHRYAADTLKLAEDQVSSNPLVIRAKTVIARSTVS